MKSVSHLQMPFVTPHTRQAVLNELEKAFQLEEMNAEVVGKTYAEGMIDGLLWMMGKIPSPSE